MKNNGENRTSIRSRNRSINNFKGALSCRFPFQNTAPCWNSIIRRFDAVFYRLTIIRSLHNLWTKAIFLFADSDRTVLYTGNLRTTGQSLFAV